MGHTSGFILKKAINTEKLMNFAILSSTVNIIIHIITYFCQILLT